MSSPATYPTMTQLEAMANAPVRDIDPGTLVNIADVRIDPGLPPQERVAAYLRQIGNPYCYISHGVTVKISFAGTKSLEECLACAMQVASAHAEQPAVRSAAGQSAPDTHDRLNVA